MPITSTPITTPHVPVFLLLGHSNADGWASAKLMLEAYPHLMSVAGGTWGAHRASPAGPTNFYWKNVYAATSAKPFPLPNHTPIASLVSTVSWLELTANNPTSPLAPHPHVSPYAYPNNRGSCYANYYYNSYKAAGSGFVRFADFSDTSTNGALCGAEIPLAWYWRHHWGTQVGVVKMAFSSSFGMAADNANSARVGWIDQYNQSAVPPSPANPDYVRSAVRNDAAGGFVGWWTPGKPVFDWAPNTDRFFKLLIDKMTGAAAALPAGTKMDVRLIVPWMGDNEAGRGAETPEGHTLLLGGWKSFVLDIVSKLRSECEAREWSRLPAHQIPVVWPKVHKGYGSAGVRNFMNGVLAQVAMDDPYFSTIEVDDLTVMLEEGYNTYDGFPGLGNHFGHKGYYNAAERIFKAFQAISTEPFDAISAEDRVTFQEVQERVKTYYNRGRVQTDVEDDVAVNQHINAGLESILNAIGDNAYWLRRKEVFAYDLGYNNVTNMPRHVARVLKIEPSYDVTKEIGFSEVGRADGGRVQIHIDYSQGDSEMVTHYMYRPRPLTVSDQLVPLPRTCAEWLVVEAARRLARSGANMALQATLEGEAAELRERCLKEMQVQVRTRRDTLFNRDSRRSAEHGRRYRWGP